MMGQERYWIKFADLEWSEVSKEEYVRIERAAGFHNTMGEPDEPATASFSNGYLHGTTIDPYGAIG